MTTSNRLPPLALAACLLVAACGGGGGGNGGVVGSPCTSNTGCFSGICLPVNRCSRSCTTDADCPPSWTCGALNARRACLCAPSGAETCNGRDDDCNGMVDEGVLCGAGQVCQGAACVCLLENRCPPNLCVDKNTDAANCGACGKRCAVGQSCVAGACACPQGFTACAAGCTDLATDVRNCGACANGCAAGATCVAGACRCPAAQMICAGACTAVDTDAKNCGACANVCSGGTTCVAGACRCPGGQMLCGGACTAVDRDAKNCGGCGNACPPGASCSGGLCACPMGQMACGGACTAVDTDRTNCGGCGNVCPVGASCVAGVCRCPQGQSVCSAACVDLQSDVANCGGCGQVCPAGGGKVPRCSGGVCSAACGNGFFDCDGNAGNGCETPVAALQNDPANCGSCGHSCGGLACQAGKCAYVTLASGIGALLSLAVNSTTVYFTGAKQINGNWNSLVYQVPLAGGNPSMIFTGPYVGSGDHLELDATYVYWSDLGLGTLKRGPLGGGNLVTLYTGVTVKNFAIDGVYAYLNASADIVRVPLAGGMAVTLALPNSPRNALAIDRSFVYYTDGNEVRKTPLAGGASQLVLGNAGAPSHFALDATNLYFVSWDVNGATLRSLPLAGGMATALAQSKQIGGTAVDVSGVYFTDLPNGTLSRVPIGGGPVELLADQQNGPTAIALDAKWVYWINNWGGELRKLPE